VILPLDLEQAKESKLVLLPTPKRIKAIVANSTRVPHRINETTAGSLQGYLFTELAFYIIVLCGALYVCSTISGSISSNAGQ
jgi:hypothetical protein